MAKAPITRQELARTTQNLLRRRHELQLDA
jgi:hypothetical protein